MKQSILYINGKYLKVNPKTLEAFTPGVFQGKGVFETMLAIGEKVLDVNLHLKRLKSVFPKAKVSARIIQKVVKENHLSASRVRVVVWQQGRTQHVAVMALKYTLPQQKEYKVCLIKTNRAANSHLANIKSLDYALFADAYKKAKEAGFDEVLLLNNKDYIFEASRSNVFWIKEGKLFTPPLSSGCLSGITRAHVIQKSNKLKVPFQEKSLSLKEILQADQVFLTNSLIGFMPVVKTSFQNLRRIS